MSATCLASVRDPLHPHFLHEHAREHAQRADAQYKSLHELQALRKCDAHLRPQRFVQGCADGNRRTGNLDAVRELSLELERRPALELAWEDYCVDVRMKEKSERADAQYVSPEEAQGRERLSR